MRFHTIWLLYHGYIRVIIDLLSQVGLIYDFKAELILRGLWDYPALVINARPFKSHEYER